MTIELTPEHQRLIEHVLHSGVFHDPQEVISAALEAMVQDLQLQKDLPLQPAQAEQRAAIERLKTFGKTQGLSLDGMTLRQLRQEARP